MKRLNHNKPNGFSLIEMVLVITIIAIVAGIATLSWQRWHQHSQQQFSQQQLLFELKSIRLLALQKDINYRCHANKQSLLCEAWVGNVYDQPQWKQQFIRKLLASPFTFKADNYLYFLSCGEILPFSLSILKGDIAVKTITHLQLIQRDNDA